MDKRYDFIERKENSKRPRWLTLCMMASAASVIILAGCGDNDEAGAPPAEEPAPLEQDEANGQNSSLEPEMDEMEQDPGLEENSGSNSGSEGSMTQGTGADEPMSDEENMPEDTMDEPAEGTMNPDEDEAGFGEGTDPMPGADENGAEDEDENSTS